jgi:hypothetical protein
VKVRWALLAPFVSTRHRLTRIQLSSSNLDKRVLLWVIMSAAYKLYKNGPSKLLWGSNMRALDLTCPEEHY